LLAFVPAPGSAPGDYSMRGALPGWVDRSFLPGQLRFYGFGDNEGILSTIGALGTTLLGVLAGHWLRSRWRPWPKVAGLLLAGVVCLILGSAWDRAFPIIKNIWTSSYVLYAGGWSLLLLAFFYGAIDVLGYRRWAYFFVVIGANAILIYIAPRFIDFPYTTRFVVGGLARHLGSFAPVLLAMSLVGIKWLCLLYLYRKRIFLRV
jgi:predicted acyltransferase